MVCRSMPIGPEGRLGTAIVCSRAERPRKCKACGEKTADLLCDFPRPRKRSGTCDANLCERCAVVVGDDRHHCPKHPREGVESAPPRSVRSACSVHGELGEALAARAWDRVVDLASELEQLLPGVEYGDGLLVFGWQAFMRAPKAVRSQMESLCRALRELDRYPGGPNGPSAFGGNLTPS